MLYVHDAETDRSLTLSDGRTLSYSEFGDPGGYPIINNHGGLINRLEVEPVSAIASELGVRIVSPDRPGIGLSTRAPDRDTLSWTDDVDELLDALGIDRFATMGYSMGGQYALATTHRFGDRVQATGIIAGCPPLDDGATFAELNPLDKRLSHLSARKPAVARTTFSALGRFAGRFPRRFAKLAARTSSPSDRAAMLEYAELMGVMLSGAAADPMGLVDEYVAWLKPWRFDPATIATPVEIWQGTVDDLVRPFWASRMADAIPGAVLHEIVEEGHLIGLTRRAEVVARLHQLATA